MGHRVLAFSGVWSLAVAVAVTLVLDPERRHVVVGGALGSWWVIVLLVLLWSALGAALGAVLDRIGGSDGLPSWLAWLNGWMAMSLVFSVAGVAVLLLPESAGHQARALVRTAMDLAVVGLAWFAIVDLGHLLLARLARRAAVPFVSIALIAVTAGLLTFLIGILRLVIAWKDTELPAAMTAVSFGYLVIAALLVFVIELPASLLRRRRPPDDPDLPSGGRFVRPQREVTVHRGVRGFDH